MEGTRLRRCVCVALDLPFLDRGVAIFGEVFCGMVCPSMMEWSELIKESDLEDSARVSVGEAK